jgi:two-component system, cell cycle sensor histidine kinase and response regulator CckA
LGLFVLTLLIASGLQALSFKINLTIPVVFALVAAAWYGGLGPGLLLALLIQVTTILSNKPPPESTLLTVVVGHISVFTLLLFIVVVMSERRKSEGSLREQRELLQVTLSSIGDGLVATDAEGKISFINPAAEIMTGWPAREAVGHHADEVFRMVNEESGETISVTTETPQHRSEDGIFAGTILVKRNGEKIPIENMSSHIKDRDGGVIGGISVFHDISTRRRAEQALVESESRLRQSQKMEAIGTLTGGVAHDFNNLLTAILGNVQLGLRKLKPGSPVQVNLVEIEKAGNRAAGLTRQLLAFSRRQRLNRGNVDLNDAIADIFKLIERVIGADVDITAEFEPKLWLAFADHSQIEQVIMNLCINARDAMPDGGRLAIETANLELDEHYTRHYPYVQPGKYVQIKVSDTGHGMDEETRERIFEPFFTTKENYKGTGLGLSMAYGIVKQHDGHINVYSEPGHGTTFKIFLPAIEEHVEAETHISQKPGLPNGNETILIAEDEESLRNLAQDILESLGYRVLMAKNGEEAVEIYRENSDDIDLLLLDVVMPVVGGAEAYDRICAIAGDDLPLIFMTGYSSEIVSRGFAKDGRSSATMSAVVIQKPYSLDELGQKVREVLDSVTHHHRR